MSQPKKGDAKPDSHRMRIVPVYFPEVVVEAIDRLIELGVYPDRSSAVRSIVILGLPEVFAKYGLLEDLSVGGYRATAPHAPTSLQDTGGAGQGTRRDGLGPRRR
jgi:hypothetical protein